MGLELLLYTTNMQNSGIALSFLLVLLILSLPLGLFEFFGNIFGYGNINYFTTYVLPGLARVYVHFFGRVPIMFFAFVFMVLFIIFAIFFPFAFLAILIVSWLFWLGPKFRIAVNRAKATAIMTKAAEKSRSALENLKGYEKDSQAKLRKYAEPGPQSYPDDDNVSVERVEFLTNQSKTSLALARGDDL